MTSYSITTRHKGNMAFETEIGNHKVVMDTLPDIGGDDSGASPKKLLLGTLAACTGIDVVSLLNKMRAPFSDFEILTETDLTDEHPRVFKTIRITYRIRVADEHREKVEKAVDMSLNKYCGISAMLNKNSPMEHQIEYLRE
ncbi:MAG: OsmC family protein [Saprospiraceae bacterium]